MDEEIFKKKLTPEQYRVMRQKGTETAFTGKYWDSEKDGEYVCAACGNALFSSKEKFDAKTGWPSFKKPAHEKNIDLVQEPGADGRTEVLCKKCGSHLGYIIPGKENHYRINSASLNLKEEDGSIIEDLQDELEGQLEDALDEESNKEDNSGNGDQKQPPSSGPKPIIKSILTFLGGAVAGTAIGASAVSMLCQAPATPGGAPVVMPAATSTPSAAPITSVPLSTTPTTPAPKPTPVLPAGGVKPKTPSTGTLPSSTSAAIAQPSAATTTAATTTGAAANQTSSSAQPPSSGSSSGTP